MHSAPQQLNLCQVALQVRSLKRPVNSLPIGKDWVDGNTTCPAQAFVESKSIAIGLLSYNLYNLQHIYYDSRSHYQDL